MKRGHPHELSPDKKKVHARAVRLEWLTLAYLLSAVVNAVADLIDIAPTLIDGSARDPLPARVQTELTKLAWVKHATARLREEGHVFSGEVFLVPAGGSVSTAQLAEANDILNGLDWRLYDVVLVPVGEAFDPPWL